MSAYVKKHWSKAAKIAGAILFALLMFVNVKLTTDPNNNGDIDLLGLKLSLFTPSVYAKRPCPENECNEVGCHIYGCRVCTMMLCNPGPGGYTCYYECQGD